MISQEFYNNIKTIMEELDKNFEKVLRGNKSSAKRCRKNTLQLREAIDHFRRDLLATYKKENAPK